MFTTRNPGSTAVAIRFVAVHLGGAQALYDAARAYLQGGRRTDHPIQRLRAAEMAMADRVGRPLAARAARRSSTASRSSPQRVAAYVGMARLSVEAIAQDIIRTTERMVGARGLMRPHSFARLIRDLTMYLRQPAPDAVMDRVGRHVLDHGGPAAPPLAQEPRGARRVHAGRRARTLTPSRHVHRALFRQFVARLLRRRLSCERRPLEFRHQSIRDREVRRHARRSAARPIRPRARSRLLHRRAHRATRPPLWTSAQPRRVPRRRWRRPATDARPFPRSTFERRYLPGEFPAGTFDLILVSEVGYYLALPDLRALRERCINGLAAGGHLLLVHWTPFVPDYPLTGDQVHATFGEAATGERLRHLLGRREEKYRLDLFERV